MLKWEAEIQFCVYLCDRFILPALSREEVGALASGQVLLDERVADFVHANLAYSFVITQSGADALALERVVLWTTKPMLNATDFLMPPED